MNHKDDYNEKQCIKKFKKIYKPIFLNQHFFQAIKKLSYTDIDIIFHHLTSITIYIQKPITFFLNTYLVAKIKSEMGFWIY